MVVARLLENKILKLYPIKPRLFFVIALRGGLPVVVARLPDERLVCAVPLPLLVLLLLHQAGDHEGKFRFCLLFFTFFYHRLVRCTSTRSSTSSPS